MWKKVRDVKFKKREKVTLESVTHKGCDVIPQEGKVESKVHKPLDVLKEVWLVPYYFFTLYFMYLW